MMAAPDLLELRVAEIEPSPFNPRRIRREDPATQDLADSIRAVGVLQPPTVRALADGGYELVAGERRWCAAGVAELETIPCLVRELSDREAREICVTENLQRVDLSPLEEADGVATLLEDYEGDVRAVAAQLGRSAGWVARRARLSTLTERWCSAIADPEHEAAALSVGHLELIARLAPEAQDDLLRQRSTCHPGLFDDELDAAADVTGELGRCLNPTCWDRKVTVVRERRIADVSAKTGKDVLLVRDGRNHGPFSSDDGAVNHWTVERAKKSDKGAVPALTIDEHGNVGQKHRWVKPIGSSGGSPGSSGSSAKGGKKTLAEKEAALADRRKARAVQLVAAELEGVTKPPKWTVPMAAVFGTRRRIETPHLDSIAHLGDLCWRGRDDDDDTPLPWERALSLIDAKPREALTALWEQVRGTMLARLGCPSVVDAWREAGHVCELLDLSLEAFHAQAVDELPEPKAWAAEREGA